MKNALVQPSIDNVEEEKSFGTTLHRFLDIEVSENVLQNCSMKRKQQHASQ